MYASSSSSLSPPRKHRRQRYFEVEGPAKPAQLAGKPAEAPASTFSTSTAALPSQQPMPEGLISEARLHKRMRSPSSDEDAPFSLRFSESEEGLPQQGSKEDLPEGEVVGSDTGDPHASSPSEDFSSYS